MHFLPNELSCHTLRRYIIIIVLIFFGRKMLWDLNWQRYEPLRVTCLEYMRLDEGSILWFTWREFKLTYSIFLKYSNKNCESLLNKQIDRCNFTMNFCNIIFIWNLNYEALYFHDISSSYSSLKYHIHKKTGTCNWDAEECT